jgi:CRP/FNR family cyclic AMP-dependent transcriptional regulator
MPLQWEHKTMDNSRTTLLQGMPVFGATTSETLAFILEHAIDFDALEGEYFFRRDDEALSFFVLESGRVEVLREHGRRNFRLSELGPGDCFGEMSLIECRNRNASVRALQDSTAIEVPLAALHELYERDVDQYLLIQLNIAREISRRLREADRRLFERMVAASEGGGDYWWYVV